MHQLLALIISLLLISCNQRINIGKIKYDNTNDFYSYRINGFDNPLRNQNDELITRNNLDSFLLKINEDDLRYDINQITENANFIKREDAELVNLYAGITCSIRLKSFSGANFFINELKRKYPDAYKYTDLLFLEGLKWQILSNHDSAKLCFTNFLKLSGSKYSQRFRGYYFSDSAALQFTEERNYAKSFLHSEKLDPENFYKNDIFPKYYYESFSQGFVLNKEDFGNQKIIPGIALAIGNHGSYLYGIGAKWLVNQNIAASGQFSITDYYFGALADIPIQLYKSPNNSLGIKFTPLIYYQFVKKTRNFENVNRGYLNPGAGLSISYHFTQRLYLGTSYLYYFYNQFDKADIKGETIEVNQINEYDISLYYQLIKGVSFKAGMVNKLPVIGFTLTGNNFVYKFRTKTFELRPKIY